MNIAVFTKRTTFHKGYGGLETQNKLLCEGLSSRGHTVVVFSPRYELDRASQCERGITYVFVDCVYRALAGLAKYQKKNWLNRSVFKFMELHKAAPFDVVLSQSSAGLGIIEHRNKIKVPIVSISHGTAGGEVSTRLRSADITSLTDIFSIISDIGYFLFNFFVRQREFVRHSNRVVAVSDVVKESLINETFVGQEKIVVVHNGIPAPAFLEQSNNNEFLELLYVGRVDKTKGLDDLVCALQSEELQQARLTIVGSGDYLEDLKVKVLDEDTANRVTFTGLVPHEEVLSHMRSADVFVLPSKRAEGFPMTLIEAMFASLPIVGSDMGGIPEAITHGITGFVYKSGSVAELTKKLVHLAKDEDLRKNMGSWALEKARMNFTVDVMLDGYEKVLREEMI